MSISVIVTCAFVYCFIDWVGLLHATIKKNTQLKQANQPQLGSSTYWMVYMQLFTFVLLTLIYYLVSPTITIPNNAWSVLLASAIILVVFKVLIATVSTLFNFVVIRVLSHKYEKESKEEL